MMKRYTSLLFIVTLLFCFSCSKKEDITPERPSAPDPIDNTGSEYIPNQNIKVYVGGGDNATGAFLGYLGDTSAWTYVQQNADGYYINNFALNTNKNDALQNQRLTSLSVLFKNKSAFYETDQQRTDDVSDQAKIEILKADGFNVNYAIINRGVTDSRLVALKSGGPIKIMGMGAPWLVDGDINSSTDGALAWRDGIAKTDGSGIDGPLGLWITNDRKYQQGSFSGVKYAHKLGKIAMVMISPYESKTPDALLAGSIDCIQKHEDAGASPDLWGIEYYAAQIQQYPVTPEKTATGEPAKSLTGVAYYLIRHLNGKSKVELSSASSNLNIVNNGNVLKVKLPQNNGKVDFSIPLTLSSTDDDWVDVCPLIKGTVDNDNYTLTYVLNGMNITKAVTGKGFPCFNTFRLKGVKKNELVLRIKSKSGNNAAGVTNITVDLMSHSGLPSNKVSSLQISCSN